MDNIYNLTVSNILSWTVGRLY